MRLPGCFHQYMGAPTIDLLQCCRFGGYHRFVNTVCRREAGGLRTSTKGRGAGVCCCVLGCFGRFPFPCNAAEKKMRCLGGMELVGAFNLERRSAATRTRPIFASAALLQFFFIFSFLTGCPSVVRSCTQNTTPKLAALAKSSKCKSMGIVLPEGCGEGSTQALAQVSHGSLT